jgi:hypothetical protein
VFEGVGGQAIGDKDNQDTEQGIDEDTLQELFEYKLFILGEGGGKGSGQT